MPAGAEQPVYAPYRERVAADVGAAKLWLTNRRGETWRDKTETDVNVRGELAELLAQRRQRVAEGRNGDQA